MQSPKARAHNLSEAHIAMLRENVRKWREEHGGKVPTRKGVPDGWGSISRKKLRKETIRMAESKAEQAVERLIKDGVLDKDGAGNAVLQWACHVVLAKTEEGESCYPVRDQLQAAKIVMEYTTAKPASTQKVQVSAEDFLQGLLAGEQPRA
jgi:hypothetical protein